MRLQLERVQVSCFASLYSYTQGGQQAIKVILGHFRPILAPFWAILDPKGPREAKNAGGGAAKMGQKGVNRPKKCVLRPF